MKGGAGLGDPLLRARRGVRRDVEEGHLLPRFAESVYGVSDREAFRRRRLERAMPVREWVAAERERILAQELAEPVKAMYAESMRLSPRWAAEYRGFWDLPEDFEYDVATPDGQGRALRAGQARPRRGRRRLPRRLRPARRRGGAARRSAGGKLDERDARGAARREA